MCRLIKRKPVERFRTKLNVKKHFFYISSLTVSNGYLVEAISVRWLPVYTYIVGHYYPSVRIIDLVEVTVVGSVLAY